jgi:hypothetical protein
VRKSVDCQIDTSTGLVRLTGVAHDSVLNDLDVLLVPKVAIRSYALALGVAGDWTIPATDPSDTSWQ